MNENPDFTPSPAGNNGRKTATAITVAIVLLVLIAIASVWYITSSKTTSPNTPDTDNAQTKTSQPPKSDQPANTPQTIDSTARKNIDTKITESKSFITVENFLKAHSSLTPAQVTFVKQITKFDQLTTDENNEHIAFLFSVADPENSSILYFARYDFDGNSALTEVYRLNNKTETNELLYRSDSADTEFDLEGIQGSKLLFFKKDASDSPGPCFNDWTYAYENPMPRPADQTINGHDDYRTMQALDLNDYKAGLKYFLVPREKYEIEKKVQEQCSAEFDKLLEEGDSSQQSQ